MKLAGVIFLCFAFLYSCTWLFGDTHSYQASWDANSEPDMLRYDLYVWSGSDSLGSPFVDSTRADLYGAYFVKSIIHPNNSTNFDAIADGQSYIQIALSAVDIDLNSSRISVSNIIKAKDLQSPGKVNTLVITK